MDVEDFYTSEWAQVKTPSLYQGQFVLVGDAGYAPNSTETGTNMTIAGAHVLAERLGSTGGI
ncbi:uncharacterized protein N7484_007833 [Penicillium longicatenatum]|uniref:uncharacterized protein n=1 Tax=Penicillium longicatenatum TaxID=1561947 RepID=UPI002548EB6B|nr:uncharacterized protein N7484_007833 [Penicillium longicatenatum]KAJ5639971.1 hypothetical protein N7484_007833 [Penicillium longicatenatum]